VNAPYNAIRAIRERMGLSQEEFAAGVGCTQSNISHLEVRKQSPLIGTAKKIVSFANSRGLDITLNDVYAEEDPQQQEQRAA